MASWVMPLFTIVVAVALFIEMLVIVGVFLAMRRLIQRIEQITERLQGRPFALISQVQLRLEEVQPHISSIVRDSSGVMHSTRDQADQVGVMITELLNGVETNFTRADRKITRVLENIEHRGPRIRRTLLAPLQTVKALTTGVATGINVYRRHVRESSGQTDLSPPWIPSQADTEGIESQSNQSV